MLLNGPAARLAVTGDKVVIPSYCGNDGRRSPHVVPIVVFVDEKNRQT